MSDEVCPWCQTDILWDEEIGPEETCPHCYNELKSYRTIEIKAAAEAENTPVESRAELEIVKSDINEEFLDKETEELLAEIDDEPQGLAAYEFKVEELRDAQVEEMLLECLQCEETMIYAGHHKMEQQYTPFVPAGFNMPFIKAPFTVNMHICPVCFEIRYNLADPDRMKIIEQFK
jgi:hypothetical protein